jgi:hypothetical protein
LLERVVRQIRETVGASARVAAVAFTPVATRSRRIVNDARSRRVIVVTLRSRRVVTTLRSRHVVVTLRSRRVVVTTASAGRVVAGLLAFVE